MGIFTIVSWLPNIVVRNILDSQDENLIKATQNVFYLNAIFDPVVYIFAEKLLSLVSCLNPWERVRVNYNSSLEMKTVRASRPNN